MKKHYITLSEARRAVLILEPSLSKAWVYKLSKEALETLLKKYFDVY